MRQIKIKFNKSLEQVIYSFAIALVLISTVSCVDELILPEEGSIADATPPTADFTAIESENFLIYNFSNTSKSATSFEWNFAELGTSTDSEPQFEFPAEGVYSVTLVARDNLNVSNSTTKEVNVVEPPEPPAINPDVINGDFSDGVNDWRIESWEGGNTYPFGTTSDGEGLDYDGNTLDAGKSPGAKWQSNHQDRYAYQAITVSPGREYTAEYSYAIKNNVEDIEGGDRIEFYILSGHFTDGNNAQAAATDSAPLKHLGLTASGKGNFTLVRETFTAPDSGLISIWIHGVTAEDTYVDNVKIYPVD